MNLPKSPDESIKKAYQFDKGEVFKALRSSEQGLSLDEAEKRLNEYGKNELKEFKKDSPLKLFLKKFLEPLILLLLASAVISLLIGETADAIGISVAVSLVVILGFIQEHRSERTVEALKKLTTYTARVIRGGGLQEIQAENLVPGDVLVLNVGDRVAADLRLFETLDLQIDESLLTGESSPVKKSSETIEMDEVPLSNRVTNGRGRGIVTATGGETELGLISSMIQDTRRSKTPLQLKLDQLGKQISLFALTVIVVIFSLGVLKGMKPGRRRNTRGTSDCCDHHTCLRCYAYGQKEVNCQEATRGRGSWGYHGYMY
jgi:Ca2+-transporting ATPase